MTRGIEHGSREHWWRHIRWSIPAGELAKLGREYAYAAAEGIRLYVIAKPDRKLHIWPMQGYPWFIAIQQWISIFVGKIPIRPKDGSSDQALFLMMHNTWKWAMLCSPFIAHIRAWDPSWCLCRLTFSKKHHLLFTRPSNMCVHTYLRQCFVIFFQRWAICLPQWYQICIVL